MLALKSMCLKLLQDTKDQYSMCLSDAGAVKDLSPERENAHIPRVFSLSLGTTDYNVSALSNASA